MTDKSITSIDMIIDGDREHGWSIVLAHGAGQDMVSDFMAFFARTLSAQGCRIVRFRFPYMAATARDGRTRPPDREPRLRAAWHAVLDQLHEQGIPNERLIIGGKSLGARMATMIAAERKVAGVICLGYPFHASGRPEGPRIDHLRDLAVPTLICQGTRDPFGNLSEVGHYELSSSIRIRWVDGGDHSFRPNRVSGRSWEDNLGDAAHEVREFLQELEGRGAD